jgi:hypothetical protein
MSYAVAISARSAPAADARRPISSRVAGSGTAQGKARPGHRCSRSMRAVYHEHALSTPRGAFQPTPPPVAAPAPPLPPPVPAAAPGPAAEPGPMPTTMPVVLPAAMHVHIAGAAIPVDRQWNWGSG